MSANRGAGPASENIGDGGTVSGHTRTKGWRSIRVRMMLPIAVATLGVIVLGVLQNRGRGHDREPGRAGSRPGRRHRSDRHARA